MERIENLVIGSHEWISRVPNDTLRVFAAEPPASLEVAAQHALALAELRRRDECVRAIVRACAAFRAQEAYKAREARLNANAVAVTEALMK
jgi:hypothetical protein